MPAAANLRRPLSAAASRAVVGAVCSVAAVCSVGCEGSELLAVVERGPLVSASTDAGGSSISSLSDAGLVRDAGPMTPAPTVLSDAAPLPVGFDAAPPLGDAGLGAARPVVALNDPVARDTDVTVTDDLLELYFMSTRTGSKDIFRSLRSDALDPWGAPELVSELSLGGQDENPCVANDGLQIWFFTDRDRALGSIWHSTRESREQPWAEPTPVTALTIGAGASDVAIAVSADRTRYILSSKAAGGVPYNLYESVLDVTDGTLGMPTTLDEVSSVYDDFDPDLAEAGRFIAFDSFATTARRIFWARRGSVDELFSTPVPLLEIPEALNAGAVSVSEDSTHIWFSSNVAGSADIYELILDRPPQ